MIARVWYGWTSPENADAYEELLRRQILPDITARAIPGYGGAHLLRREEEGEVEFVTVLWFENLGAVRAFAGEEYEASVVPGEARALLSRYDRRSRHYEVVREPGG